MQYNFDEVIQRKGTGAFKYDARKEIFGNENAIPMWVADMDFRTPDFVIEALKKRFDHEIFGYTKRADGFNSSLIQWVEKRHGWKIQPEWISFSPGVVPACSLSVLAFTNPGDKVIVQPPVYFPFFEIVRDNGRELVYNQLIEKDGRFTMDFDDLEQKASEGAKMLIISHPHNPGGSVWLKDELLRIGEIVEKYDMLIISDEIHSDLIFKPHKHIPLASLSKEIANRTITTIAPSKTFNMAGFSTAAVVFSNKAMKLKYEKILATIHIGLGNIFGAIGFEAAYTHGEEWLEQLLEYLSGNIQFVAKFIREQIPEIKVMIPEATYMIWLDCRDLGMDTKELNRFMIHDAGVAMNDGAMFGPSGEGFLRMNVSCPRSVVEKALNNMKSAISKTSLINL
ncbi:MalY/PatB family protein [Candidatus Venteria ishoeyi]|uniref:cysteine-S-conjugate beta-lyase n=1 Tax=Candidatus Venteria ishoeyi TaxID=1899563 RepID=A0A1H6FBD7_9GAMM|nr:PatB family C-S lyase [Candidatus Venteria ishoeyi]SEH06446.1 Cystathionine beta-lyase PatB [Candidatus Venteria ishoeyi]